MPKKNTKFKGLLARRPKISKTFLVVAAVATAGVGTLVLTNPSLAYYTPYKLKVCNSSASVAPILVYESVKDSRGYLYPARGKYKDPGECDTRLNYGVRVDVDPFNQGVRSYKIGRINYGYNDCHVNNPNPASNPPNDSGDYGIRYRNYKSTNCQ